MKIIVSLLLACGLAAAQQGLPQDFVGACGSYGASANSHGSCFTAAFLVNASQQLYSYSSYDISFRKGVATAATRTGFATVIRRLGPISILAIGMAGGQSSQSATQASVAGAVAAAIPLGKSGWYAMGEYLGANHADGASARFVILWSVK